MQSVPTIAPGVKPAQPNETDLLDDTERSADARPREVNERVPYVLHHSWGQPYASYRPICVYCQSCGRYLGAFHEEAKDGLPFPTARFAAPAGCLCSLGHAHLKDLLNAKTAREIPVIIYLTKLRLALMSAGATYEAASGIEQDSFPFAEERRKGIRNRLKQIERDTERSANARPREVIQEAA